MTDYENRLGGSKVRMSPYPLNWSPLPIVPRFGWCESCGRPAAGYLMLEGANVPWCWLDTCSTVISRLYDADARSETPPIRPPTSSSRILPR